LDERRWQKNLPKEIEIAQAALKNGICQSRGSRQCLI
jgi:hypothetical protein